MKRLNNRPESPRFSKCRKQLKQIGKSFKNFISLGITKEQKQATAEHLVPKSTDKRCRIISRRVLDPIKMPAKIKMRSVSVEDLGNIVKQMIDGVLEDNDQVVKLREAVFKEYYFKRMEELKEVKAKIDAEHKLNKTAENPKMVTFEPKVHLQQSNIEVGDAEAGYIDKSIAKQSDFHEMLASPSDGITPEDCPHRSTSSKSAVALNSEKAVEEAAGTLVTNKLDIPVVHVVWRPKHVRASEDIRGSDIALGLANQQTTTDLTQNSNNSVTPSTNSKVQVEWREKLPPNVELIEWQRRSSKNKVAPEENDQSGKPREIPVQFKDKGEIAFENWKKAKTETYHRVFREEQRKNRTDQAARARQNEKKEIANEAYMYWRRQQDARQKSSNIKKRMLVKLQESQRMESSEKRRANSQAFRAWKKQKDVKLRERRMYMMAYSEQNKPHQIAKPQKPKPGVHVAFNMWLDQLDCVLHQKYLRERRYLVRSFYCQPAYFGTAALCS